MSVGLFGCSSGGSVVSDQGSKNSAPAVQATPQATPAAVQSAATPSPTPSEMMRRAQAQPGIPVTVPESMRRPLNREELQRALQQMPPEVRARILQGQPGLAQPKKQ